MKVSSALIIFIIGTAVVAEQNNKKESMVSSSYGGGTSYSGPATSPYGSGMSYPGPASQTYSLQGAQSYSAPAGPAYSAPTGVQSYLAPASVLTAPSYSAPTTQSYTAPLSSAPFYKVPVAPVSFTAPPCQRNYIISCQPNLRPVSCGSPSPYGSVGAYSEYMPAYILPSTTDYDY